MLASVILSLEPPPTYLLAPVVWLSELRLFARCWSKSRCFFSPAVRKEILALIVVPEFNHPSLSY